MKYKSLIAAWLFTLPFLANAGVFFEHKFIGDSAFRRFVRENGLEQFFLQEVGLGQFTAESTPFRSNPVFRQYYPGLFYFKQGEDRYSYGDLTALSGDHSLSLMQMVEGLFDSLFTDQAPPEKFAPLIKELKNAWSRQSQAMDLGKKEADYFFLSYVLLANEDESHFQRPPLSVRQMLGNLSKAFIDSFDYIMNNPETADNSSRLRATRARVERNFLKFNNSLKYSFLHLVGMYYMRMAAVHYSTGDKEQFSSNFKVALIANAFADHFLQDAFAAGHIPVRRSIRGLDNKGIHDFYCRNGLWVTNGFDSSWRTFGDNFYDATTYRFAIDANTASLKELYSYFKQELINRKNGIRIPSLYEKFAAGLLPVELYPDSALAQINAFNYLPVPPDEKRYKAIELKKGSKLGAYIDVMLFSNGNNTLRQSVGLSPVGWGFTDFKGEGNRVVREALYRGKKETVWWGGFAANYSWWKREKFRVHTVVFGFDFTYRDRWVLETKWGWVSEGRNYFLWRPTVGYEFKSLRFPLAPSVKFFYDVTAYAFRHLGIGLNLRLY